MGIIPRYFSFVNEHCRPYAVLHTLQSLYDRPLNDIRHWTRLHYRKNEWWYRLTPRPSTNQIQSSTQVFWFFRSPTVVWFIPSRLHLILIQWSFIFHTITLFVLACCLNFKLLENKNCVLYFFEYFTVYAQIQNILLTGWFDKRSQALAITCALLLYTCDLTLLCLFLCSEISTRVIGKKN